jgi:hypothetical protein
MGMGHLGIGRACCFPDDARQPLQGNRLSRNPAVALSMFHKTKSVPASLAKNARIGYHGGGLPNASQLPGIPKETFEGPIGAQRAAS